MKVELAVMLPGARELRPLRHLDEIQKFVEQDCGAEGFTLQGDTLLAVKFVDGIATAIKRYALQRVHTRG